MSVFPQITFGMIVLNGEPFTRYNLRALYPWAHQIIVVEGACPGARMVASADGHSTDGTLEILRRFVREEDPEGKIVVVTAEDEGHPDGHWPGEKHEMSQAYAKRATGNYLWQVDCDEFYHDDDMRKVNNLLAEGVDSMDFNTLSFWGGIDYVSDGFWLICAPHNFNRVFAWGPGYRYTTHRPPTVVDERGVDTRTKRYVRAEEMERMGVCLYHYCLVFPKQVLAKASYYSQSSWCELDSMAAWARQCWMGLRHPFRVHNCYQYMSWLKRFSKPHPPQILQMMEDIRNGTMKVELRETADIERLLSNPFYRVAVWGLDRWAHFCCTRPGRWVRGYGIAAWNKALRAWGVVPLCRRGGI